MRGWMQAACPLRFSLPKLWYQTRVIVLCAPLNAWYLLETGQETHHEAMQIIHLVALICAGAALFMAIRIAARNCPSGPSK